MFVAVVVVVAIVLTLVLTRVVGGRHDDGVASFQRQIDALSSDARRPIVGRVESARAERDDSGTDTADDSTDKGDDHGA